MYTSRDPNRGAASGSSDHTQISCCISCGDRNVTDEFIELFRPFESPDVILSGQHDYGRTQKKCPRRFIGNSAYIRMFLKPGLHKKRLTFDVSEVCRRHLRGECDKGASCKFLHVCRQWWKASQPQSSANEHVCLSCGNVTKGRTLQCTECPGALSQVAFAFIHDLSKSVQTVETQWTNWIFSQASTAAQAQAHASQGLTLRQRRQRLLQTMQHASQSIREDESAHSDNQPASGGIPPAHVDHAAAPSEGAASAEPQSWDPLTFNQILQLLQPLSSMNLNSLGGPPNVNP